MIVQRKPGIVLAIHPDGRKGVVVHKENTSSELVYVRVLASAKVNATGNWPRNECTFRFVSL